jgi:hypothetical protein
MTVMRGKEQVFLGMHIKCTGIGMVVTTMKGYLRQAITDSGLNVQDTVASPTEKDLFEADLNAAILKETEHERFHSVVCKILYVATCTCVDILLPTGFLCARVTTKSTTEDQERINEF